MNEPNNTTLEGLKLETRIVDYEVKDNILYCRLKNMHIIGKDEIEKLINTRKILIPNHVRIPLIVDSNGITKTTFEARRVLSDEQHINSISSIAVVVSKKFDMNAGNLLLQITQIPSPTKLFTQLIDAEMWSQEYK